MRGLAILLALAGAAHAGAKITMTSIRSDGLELHDLSCGLVGGTLLGGVVLAGTLSKQRAAFDACAPEGVTFHVELTLDGRRMHGRVSGGRPAQRACVERAIARVKLPLEGTCSLDLLAGKIPPPAPVEAARPAPVAAAPSAPPAPVKTASTTPAAADQPKARPSLARLRALIGQAADSPAALALLRPFEANRTVSDHSDVSYWSYKSHGLSVLLEQGAISSIIFYADHADEFSEFAGELPGGLEWSDTRADVERKLGAPQVSGGNGVIPFGRDSVAASA